jgi:ABC-2 type transport system ATP-binding protein
MIEAQGLTKRYGNTLAVDDLSFIVPPGQVTGFLGPNGAGKSTTMRMMIGLDAPTSGTVSVHGTAYRNLKHPLREVGALLDARGAHPGRSARDHLSYLAASNGISSARVVEVLEMVGLSEAARRRAGGFSLGMGQRLGIAAALLGDPPIVILDEPVNGLDPDGVVWVRTLLKDLAAEGRTVFLSSHLMSEMALIADRLLIIGRGRLLADATIDELLAEGAYVRARSPEAARLATLLRAAGTAVTAVGEATIHVTGSSSDAVGQIATANGIVLGELSEHAPSLEDRYMELTGRSVEFRANVGSGSTSGKVAA